MSKSINDGGSAFPEIKTRLEDLHIPRTSSSELHPATTSSGGMSLRAYIATKAMQSLIGQLRDEGCDSQEEAALSVASASCLFADALIAELSK